MSRIACFTALALLLSPAAVFAQNVAPSAAAPAKQLEKATDVMKKAGDLGKAAPSAPTETPSAKAADTAAPAPTTEKAATPGTVAKEETAKPAEKSDVDKKDAAPIATSTEKPAAAPVAAGQQGSTVDKAKPTVMEQATKKAGGSVIETMKPTPPAVPGTTR